MTSKMIVSAMKGDKSIGIAKGYSFELDVLKILQRYGWSVESRVGIFNRVIDSPGEIDLVANKRFCFKKDPATHFVVDIRLVVEVKNTASSWVFIKGPEEVIKHAAHDAQMIYGFGRAVNHDDSAEQLENNQAVWNSVIKNVPVFHAECEISKKNLKKIEEGELEDVDSDATIYSALRSAVSAALHMSDIECFNSKSRSATGKNNVESGMIFPIVVTSAPIKYWDVDGSNSVMDIDDKTNDVESLYKVKDFYTADRHKERAAVLVYSLEGFENILKRLEKIDIN